jgi:hypothetical protein
MDGKLKEIADNYYSVTSVNDFDSSRDCEILKHKYFMLGCELIYKEMSASQNASTSDEALPIDDVVCSDDELDFTCEDEDRKHCMADLESNEEAELFCSCGEELTSIGDTVCLDCFNEMTFND